LAVLRSRQYDFYDMLDGLTATSDRDEMMTLPAGVVGRLSLVAAQVCCDCLMMRQTFAAAAAAAGV